MRPTDPFLSETFAHPSTHRGARTESLEPIHPPISTKSARRAGARFSIWGGTYPTLVRPGEPQIEKRAPALRRA